MASRSQVRPKFLSVIFLMAAPMAGGAADFCIGGTVVNALTGEPLRRAAVTTPQTATLTDAAGVFRACGVPAGSYYVRSEKPGFTPTGIMVSVGPSREDLALRLQPLAAITGKVLDANGEPLENALIQLLVITAREGRRRVKVESSANTDDRGEYRLAGIAPGRYLVRAAGWQGSASAKDADAQTFPAVYYGGAPDLASAQPLKVDAGHDVACDFSVTLAPAYRIRGSIAGFSATLPATVQLLGSEGEPMASPITISASGAFEVSKVSPGSYVLRATQGEGDERMRAEEPVQIGSDNLTDQVLTLSRAVTVKGIVKPAEASGASPLAPSCSVDLAPAEAELSDEPAVESSTGEDGAFDIEDVLPGRYRLRMDCNAGYISAAHSGETDLLSRDELYVAPGVAPAPIEAVLNTDGATLDVAATQDKDGEALTSWFVLVPESGNDLRIRFAILKGKLSLSNLPPGDYQAYAWTGSPYEFEYANPDVRNAWAGRAVTVHLGERDHQSISIKTAPGDTP